MWLPAQIAADEVVGGVLGRWLAFAWRALRSRELDARHALHSLHDFSGRIAAAQAYVLGGGWMSLLKRVESQDMGRCQVQHVDVVADGRPVRGVHFGAGELEGLAAEGPQDGVGNQMAFGV